MLCVMVVKNVGITPHYNNHVQWCRVIFIHTGLIWDGNRFYIVVVMYCFMFM